MNVFQRVGLGLKAWYWAWFVDGGAERIEPAVRTLGLPAPDRIGSQSPSGIESQRAKTAEPAKYPATASPASTAPAKPSRSDALTLLEALQREARLIDFLKEDISPYQDAQIGAAVRDIHRDAGKVLERLFELRSILDQPENSPVSLEATDPARVRLIGNVREGVTSGTLVHHGWTATKVDLPVWSGPRDGERVVAPAEVEVA